MDKIVQLRMKPILAAEREGRKGDKSDEHRIFFIVPHPPKTKSKKIPMKRRQRKVLGHVPATMSENQRKAEAQQSMENIAILRD
jgi:hypothetical protein